MVKMIWLGAVVLMLGISAYSQTFEYGDPSELKGLTRVYVDTAGNLKDRNTIIAKLQKLNLTIVDDPSLADVLIDFHTSTQKQAVSRTIPNISDHNFDLHTVSNVKVVTGDAMVTVKPRQAGNKRVVMNFSGGKRNPAESFVNEFIKVYKKANGH